MSVMKLAAMFAAIAAATLPSSGARGTARTDDPKPQPAAGKIILATGGYWRQHVTCMPPLVSLASAKAAGMKLDQASRALKVKGRRARIISVPTVPPPGDWMKGDFDDSAWVRAIGPFTAGRQEIGLLCRRAKFRVKDPARVTKLSLELGYRGGVVVYLNGQEVLRESLPAGKLAARTPGADYPLDAFFVKQGERKGKPLHHYYDRALTDQFALRNRRAEAALPVAKLRRGVNVLAVASHSSQYPARSLKAGVGGFAPVGLTKLFLRAVADKGAITPAVGRPSGLQVWNADVAEDVHQLSYGDPCEPLRPVRILAVGNGWFSGQIVLGSTRAIASLACRVGPLSAPGGAAIAPSAVRVRYARPTRPMRYVGGTVYGGPTGISPGVRFRQFDALTDTPPQGLAPCAPAERLDMKLRKSWGVPASPVPAAVVPIWVTVSVPAGTKAGKYTGSLTISAAGHDPVKVPVELKVFAWKLPDVADYTSELSVYQSPDTLAAYYKVPLWSEKHWKLIARSVRLIGEATNHTIVIPLLSKEQFGNEDSYVRWIKQSQGSFKYDTSIMCRYIDLYLKHHRLRRIKAVCVIVWGNAGLPRGNPYRKEAYDDRGLPRQTRGTFTVSLLEPASGKVEDMLVPPVGSDKYEAFWRPVLLKVREDLKQRGLGGKMLLGMPADPHPVVAAVKAFHNILPDVGWCVGNHPGSTRLRYDRADRRKIVPVVHVERVYTSALPDPATKRLFGWQRKQMALAFNRYGFGPLCLFPNPRVWAFRILMEADLASGHRGAGRIGADYWKMPDIKHRSGGGGTFYARYPGSSIGQTGMGSNYAALLAPGPDGPVTTVCFENAREGIQNAEVVIFIQKALLADKLPAPLAEKCWRALDQRINAMRTYTLGLGRAGWQDRDRRLYQLAVQVGKAMAAK